MSGFHESDFYSPAQNTYSLLPFNFHRNSSEKIRLVSLGGENIMLNSATFDQFISHSLASTSDDYRNLRSKGFLFDNDSRSNLQLLPIKLRTKFAHVFNLTALHIFVVTLKCEHSCPYCQVSRQNEGSSTKYNMTQAIADKSIDRVFESPSKNIKIEFQGGETLLNFQLIKYIVRQIEKRNIIEKRNVEYVIATNLALLDDDVLAFCDKYSIHISTSLDGPAIVHNKNRPRKGNNSHQKAIEGILRVQDYLGRDRISALMTTSPDSLDMFTDIVDEYLKLNFEGIFLRPLSPYGFAIKTQWYNKYDMENWLLSYKNALDYIIEINLSGHFFKEFYTALIAERILSPFATGYVDLMHPTGAGLSGIVYNYDGKIFASDEGRMLAEMGDDMFHLGHVNTHTLRDTITSDKSIKILKESFGYCLPKCNECTYLSFCGSDPVYHYATQSDLAGNKAYSEFCNRQMSVIDYVFELLEDRSKRRIIESWVHI